MVVHHQVLEEQLAAHLLVLVGVVDQMVVVVQIVGFLLVLVVQWVELEVLVRLAVFLLVQEAVLVAHLLGREDRRPNLDDLVKRKIQMKGQNRS